MHTTFNSSFFALWGRFVSRVFCVAVLSLGLAACGGSDDESPSPSTEQPEPTSPTAVIHCAP